MQKAFSVYGSQVFEYESKAVGDTFSVNVRLPETYSTEGDGYPVLVAMDADASFPLLADVLTLLEWEQCIPPMILVAPGYGVPLNHEKNQRARDYVPTVGEVPVDPEGSNTKTVGGGAPRFLQFIREELLPHIDETYHTDPETRMYAGVSFGGLFGTYTFLHQPDTFTHYLISSPSLWWDDRYCFRELETFQPDDLKARVFFTVGEQETSGDINMVTDLREFVNQLRGKGFAGLQMKHVALYGGHLSSQPGAMVQGLCYLFEDWQSDTDES